MSTESRENARSHGSQVVSVLWRAALGTTWRMAVPTIGLFLLGVWADRQFATKPWLMFAGVVLGFVGAYLLVNKQLGRVKRKKERKKI